MALSVAVTTVLVTCLALAAVCGAVSDMGPCLSGISGVDFNFDEFAKTNGGTWHFFLVPEGHFFDDIKSAGVQFTPTGTDGVYEVAIFNIKKSTNQKESFSRGRITYKGNGHAINEASTTTTQGNHRYEYSYLHIVPGKSAYYYICSPQGEDKTTDYRNLLVTKKPTPAEIEEIIKLDKSKNFKTPLKQLEVP